MKQQLVAITFIIFSSLASAQVAAQVTVQVADQVTETANNQLINYFFSAAKTGQTEVLTEFLNNGFPVDRRNSQSYTALMMATYYGHKNAVDILLNKGANACLKDKRGHTAMMGAIVKAEWGIAKRLYQEDCKVAHSSGKTLQEFAAVFGQTEKLRALSEALN